ncbi:peptide ABC transporter ATP-binding protein [Pullulanibacillus camelliae]|uniref:Peptide ABC transporter ATP-binding protein n=1 Tax=Pullulanibacillus camelliae TaxID=1707096 RepID=A0A8J2YG63_9BACL|nr:ABC transporter ATP-binding protein [Pullulanibacillus camelliae]GGE33849.1 peptide ABC transporter ATP-binding protein [Pullulanibacillus camelliae]
MVEAIIHMRDLVKQYKMGDNVVTALDHVTFTVEKGDFVAIVGPSGSGKSTLMNMIGCLDKPDQGEYILEGHTVNTLKDVQLAKIRNENIGFIFQNFNLLGRLTAVENVELPLIYRGMKAKERRECALRSLEQVGIVDRANHYPNQLSGGQQQRVAIARALAGTPPILLADEPTGALDSKTSQEIMDVLIQLNNEDHTIILITHDRDVAQKAKRMIMISDGRLTETEGTQHESVHIH